MNKYCEAHHEEEIKALLEKMSSCITDIGEQMELLDELRDEIECEFDDYTEETSNLEYAYAQCAEALNDARASIPTSDKKEILKKLFMFDTVTPMTQPERVAVYNFVLSNLNNTVDICWSAGNYLIEYRKENKQDEEGILPFDTNVEETIANLL